MNINRNNYEEFFLLYADNELCAADKKAVDDFITANPDLTEELVMLQQSILKPDTLVFADKEMLFKHTTVTDEQEEQLLMMLDGELDKTNREKLLQVVANNDAVRKEWELLQQTKLPADKVIFEEKEILYKEEVAKLIAIKWWRIAAAAVLIGFGIWGTVSYTNKTIGGNPDVATETKKPVNSNKAATPAVDQVSPAVKEEAKTNDEQIANVTEVKREKVAEVSINKQPVIIKEEPVVVKQVKDIAQQKVDIKTNNLPKPSLEIINSNESNKEDVAIVPTVNETNKIKEAGINQELNTKTNDVVPDNSYAVQASFDEPGDDANMEESDRKGRTKLGGFFKKIKRAIARKTNMSSDGDHNLKIANMSFAMQ